MNRNPNNFRSANYDLTIRNSSGYKFLLSVGMLYMGIMLCNAVLTNRYVGNDVLFVLGGTFTSPLIFILDDIIAEVYGYKIAQCMIISGFLTQAFFAFICNLVVFAPYPAFFNHYATYEYILGSSFLQITFSGFIAYIIANLVNSYIITRWKVILKGRRFWLRSLCSSTFSEALYSFIAILLMEFNAMPLSNIIKVALISYSIKATYSIIFAFPANLLVNKIKKLTGIDVYDFPKNLTPDKYKEELKI